ncbi:DUF935 domain-containing protein [Crenobacter luteus]|uniref:Portal protein n=1 Tax=Crenobacter luteus TaxID=1452487 RepID=A0A163D964_9NEIS|nr:DUF935 domain-containing protein [Crenobacter luteus]KZE34171.1 hypothetical protein AVW16_06765 [Crenobacter luteus]
MAQILDQHGNPIQREVLSEPQTARIGWVTREFAEHPSRGLTPQKLHHILEEAEQGQLAAQADLFADMEEKDAHIFAEMSKRKRAILTLDWRIAPPRNASAAEKKQAEQLQEWLTDLPDWDDVLLDCLDGIGHGFSALEIAWQRLGSDWLPQSLTQRPQRWFQTLPHDGNALRLRDGSVEGAEPWTFGWVIHKHKAKSGYLTRAGLHRVLAWPYLFKNYSVRDLAEFLEIYGLPLRVGKYPAGATNQEKATLLRAVAEIGHNAAGIIPDGMLIEFQNAAQGSEEPFEAMIGWCERSQSKAILGGTLTSQADGKSSTNALGNVHNEVRHDLLVSDARQLAGTLTRDLLYPLVTLNFGQVDPRRRPRLVFDTREPEDLKLYAEALPELVGLGLKVPVKWVREKLAIPEAQADDEVLVAPRPEMDLAERIKDSHAMPPELRPVTKQAQKPTEALPAEPQPKAKEEPKTALAALTREYRAVLVNGDGQVVTPAQHAIDEAEDDPPLALDEAMRKLLQPAIDAFRAGESPDAAADALLAAWPHLDASNLTELLARALFVADVWGRINGNA